MALLSGGSTYTISNVYSAWYTDDGVILTDGLSPGYGGSWAGHVGHYQTAHDFIVKLSNVANIDYVRWHYVVWTPALILAESSCVISGSTSGSTWTAIGSYSSSSWTLTNDLTTGFWTPNLAVTTSGGHQWLKFAFPTPGAGIVAAQSEYEVYGSYVVAATTETVNYLKGRRNRWDYTGVSAG